MHSLLVYYVYIIENRFGHHYTGHTSDLKARLIKHNEGGVPQVRFRPSFRQTASLVHPSWFGGPFWTDFCANVPNAPLPI